MCRSIIISNLDLAFRSTQKSTIRSLVVFLLMSCWKHSPKRYVYIRYNQMLAVIERVNRVVRLWYDGKQQTCLLLIGMQCFLSFIYRTLTVCVWVTCSLTETFKVRLSAYWEFCTMSYCIANAIMLVTGTIGLAYLGDPSKSVIASTILVYCVSLFCTHRWSVCWWNMSNTYKNIDRRKKVCILSIALWTTNHSLLLFISTFSLNTGFTSLLNFGRRVCSYNMLPTFITCFTTYTL